MPVCRFGQTFCELGEKCACISRFGIGGMNFHNAVVDNPGTKTRQAFLLFAIAVAGKKADTIVPKIRALLSESLPRELPFTYLLRLGREGIDRRIREISLGRYNTLAPAYYTVANRIDVNKTSVSELESVMGIGPKTARYFMMYAHGLECAVIDTHIKKFLRECGVASADYYVQEEEFLRRAKALNLKPSDLDNAIWRYFARNEDRDGYNFVMGLLRQYDLAIQPGQPMRNVR